MTPEQVLVALRERGETLAAAESLTGGLLLATLVGVPGASAVVRGGVVAYATELKSSVLGVDSELLAAQGAVHPQVAEQMARGVCRLTRADWGLATTGVAGPDPQDGQPVGTVFVAAVRGDGAVVEVSRLALAGDRQRIRAGSVAAAIELLGGLLSRS